MLTHVPANITHRKAHGWKGCVWTERARAPSVEKMSRPAVVHFLRNEEIHGENDPARFIFRVVSGAVRSVKTLSDGRRLVSGFHLPGDVFGLQTASVYSHRAEALADCTVAAIERSHVENPQMADDQTVRELLLAACVELERARAQMLLLGRKTASERIAAFLLEMARRSEGQDENLVELPMPRSDIADYLGLTVETVSRTLTQLERNGIIALRNSRCVELSNRPMIEKMGQ
ncbi:helix-turn-helix domain-containing protein [Terrihabitans sp. B22-R8]|uniref:helix-turn-helix domain-containing protein n=1 Tax=Terrihabitans sp. B22-R8 TaxID=3425128 RepID=UPI00403C1140